MRAVYRESVNDTIKIVELNENRLLDQLQRLVGGWLETMPVDNDIVLIYNEEGKLRRMPPTLPLFRNQELIDVIVGPVIGLARIGDEFVSLNREQTSDIIRMFKYGLHM